MAVAALMLSLLASSALATVTASQITSPSDPTLLPLVVRPFGAESTQVLSVSGTALTDDANKSDVVDLQCFYTSDEGAQAEVNVESLASTPITLTVHPDGTFTTADLSGSAQAAIKSLWREQPCTLRAVPHGTPTTANVAAFAGPRLGDAGASVNGESATTIYDDYLASTTLQGWWGWDSASSCGPYGKVFAPGSFRISSRYVSDCEASLFQRNEQGTTASIVLDTHYAYLASAAHQIHPGASGQAYISASPPVFDQSTGNLSQTETEELVRCVASDGSAVDLVNPSESSCAGFVSMGVELIRTVSTDQSGLQAQVTDQFRSTDAATHTISLDYAEEQGSSGSLPSYRFPGQSEFAALSEGADVVPPSAAPATIYFQANPLAVEPESGHENPRGAITLASEPDSIHAARDEALEFIYSSRTIPATGSLTLVQILSQSLTQGQVETLGAHAEERLSGPALAITSPSSGARLSTSPVTVSGTVTDAVDVTSVSVNGVAAALAGDGSWSASVRLGAGASTITALATDALGKTTSRSVAVTYTPPVALPAPLPLPSSTRAHIAGVGSSNGNVGLTLSCAGSAGGKCIVHVVLTTTEKLRGHRLLALSARQRTRLKRVIVGSVTVTLLVGQRSRITLKLNAGGRKLLARFGGLPVHLTATTSPGASSAPATVLSKTLSIRPARRRGHHHRHH